LSYHLEMCGRYSLKKNPVECLREYFPGIHFDADMIFTPNEDVCPTDLSPAVLSTKSRSLCTLLRWGLVPSWTQDVKPKHSFINARAETVAEKPAFKASFRRKRCVIPADSFYEWQKSPTRGKIPYRFAHPKNPFLLLAGLWDQYEGPIGIIQGFVILTTAANRSMADVHDRMPVILSEDTAREWLTLHSDDQDFQKLFIPENQPQLERNPVDSALFKTPSAQLEFPV
jgi:putative SOS response-associated peptidase YedK